MSFIACMVQRRFWQIAIPFMIAAASVGALLVHLQPILTDSGYSIEQAAMVALVIGPTSVIGRLISGFLLDHLPAKVVASALLTFAGIPYAILMSGMVSLPIGYACAVLIGLAAGAEADLLAYMVSRYFPKQWFGRVYAIQTGFFGVGFGIAPIAAGRVFDATSSYAPIFVTMAAAAVVGVLLIWSLGTPPRGEDEGLKLAEATS
jgi:predicted MFS family arabinose efflux permease